MAYYQQNALSISSRNTLAQLLAELINTNQLIEDFRDVLASIPSFDSLQLFRFLDREQKGFLAEKDLQYGLATSHRKLLTYAFSWVDVRKVGEVSRFEFADFLLPRQNLQLRQLNLKNLEQGGQLDTVSIQFRQFQRLITELMSKEMKLIELRHVLIKSQDYSLEGARFALTHSDRRWICGEDIIKFLTNFGYDCDQKQAEALIQAVSSEGEGKITFQQLKWIVEGLERKDKAYLQKIKNSNKKQPNQKPKIEERKLKEYILSQKTATYPSEQEFLSLMSRIKAIEKQKDTNQKILIEQEKNISEIVRKAYQQEVVSIQLKREQESLKKVQEREERLTQYQLKLEMEQLLRKTASLEEESDRLIRLQNRMNILEDTANIKKQIQILTSSKGQDQALRSNSHKKELRAMAEIVPSLPKSVNRQSIQNHIIASETYLDHSRQTHKRIMRDRKQQSLILNKQNQMWSSLNHKKTPGSLLNRSKVIIEPIDSQFELIAELPLKSVIRKSEGQQNAQLGNPF